ncbi:hypothetical protein NOR_04363 [Metarhizium rileyi]|uniref:Myb/SANT-like domain-containing protein n=1 Tax=Metarhizium rileyi (strain RCEF 4871) TaxID=1649241 RepID=A0A162JG01_METRR|nr:hypothetical protein NOR_04363 [Metarhizium rileyi RCEF 4871]TWU78651.1 hypothetical protein ED733_005516 [Metarhizium rileyi]
MPVSKKWDIRAELDLCMAVIQTGGSTSSYKWPAIHEIMRQLGHDFTKDAVSQHFTKVILRDFKARHGLPPGKLDMEPLASPKGKRKTDEHARACLPQKRAK